MFSFCVMEICDAPENIGYACTHCKGYGICASVGAHHDMGFELREEAQRTFAG